MKDKRKKSLTQNLPFLTSQFTVLRVLGLLYKLQTHVEACGGHADPHPNPFHHLLDRKIVKSWIEKYSVLATQEIPPLSNKRDNSAK